METDVVDNVVELLRCLWHGTEQEVIQKFRQNPALVQLEIGFEYANSDWRCICHQILERLQHNDHIFHVEKVCELIKAKSCPHVTENTPQDEKSQAGTYFITAAAALGKEDVVRYLMLKGCSLNICTKVLKLAPIHHAVIKNDLNMVHFFLAKDVDINKRCTFVNGLYTPLMLAAENGSPEMVNLLLNFPNIRLNFMNQSETGALTCGLESNNETVIDFLLAAGVTATKTTLEKAVKRNDADLVAKILSTTPLKYFEESWQIRALHASVKQGNSKMLKALFDKGFKLEYSSSVDPPTITDRMCARSFSPLHIATLSRDKEMVEVLMDAGVKVESQRVQGYTAYDIAVSMGFEDIAALMQEKSGSKLNICKGSKWKCGPFNALFSLKGINVSEFIEKLASKGYDFDKTYQGYNKPIYYAIRSGDIASLKMLIKLGASPEAELQKNAVGVLDSPLACAIRLGNIEAVKVLLYENVKITDLQVFACKDVRMFRLIVSAGADIRKNSRRWRLLYELTNLWKLKCIRESLESDFEEPESLSILCRDTIRRHYPGRLLHKYVTSQCMPSRMKKLLLLDDVLF